ncbi:MAG: cyclase family protein [Actinobacteria bacterium]|nr:cyclase family protein [Actinomycetota bacterium]
MHIVDLSLPLRPGMPGVSGDPLVRILPARTHEVDGYQVSRISLGSHAGTHLDAPRHLFPDGPTLDQYPVSRFLGPGVIIDCRPEFGAEAIGASAADAARGETHAPAKDAAPMIDVVALAEELRSSPPEPGGMVLLWTEGALLSTEGAQLLLDSGAGLVGTDGPGLDADPYPVHRLLLRQGILLAENLQGLDQLGPGPVTCAFLPLNVIDADGAPVRAVAWR